jgi:hypothetical protein
VTERRYVDILNIHEKSGRAKPLKAKRADGTVVEITIDKFAEAIAERARIESLTRDDLPKCECCGDLMPPNRIKPRSSRSKMVLICVDCPRCSSCRRQIDPSSMCLSRVLKRGGRPPRCRACDADDHRARFMSGRRKGGAPKIVTMIGSEELTTSEIASRAGVCPETIAHRIRKGLTGADLFKGDQRGGDRRSKRRNAPSSEEPEAW